MLGEENLRKRSTSEDDNNTEPGSKCQGCFCERSMCLKMYCQCFAEGKYCTSCSCQNCHNKPCDRNLKRKIKEKNNGESKYYHEAIEKEGFDTHSTVSDEALRTCRCSRSKCLKGYCDCFNAGKYCNEYCKCLNCSNKTECQISTKKQNYYRWKNFMKNTQQKVDKHKKSSSRLDFVFLPTGSLYTHLIEKTSKPASKSDESYPEIMKKLMKTLAYDHQKLSTIPDPRKMISHYCTSSVGDNKDDDKSPSQTGSRKQSSEVLRPGEMVTLTDQLTMAGQKNQENDKEKVPLLNIRALVTEAQIKSHLIVDEFMKNIKSNYPVSTGSKRLKLQ